jgi:hypothetical protein
MQGQWGRWRSTVTPTASGQQGLLFWHWSVMWEKNDGECIEDGCERGLARTETQARAAANHMKAQLEDAHPDGPR